jgi:hypothetical protein
MASPDFSQFLHRYLSSLHDCGHPSISEWLATKMPYLLKGGRRPLPELATVNDQAE